MPPLTSTFARPLGAIQWMCPGCGNLHSGTRVNIRTARVRCSHCHRAFKVGLGFSSHSTLGRAIVADLVDPHYLNFRGNPITTLIDIVARIVGQIEWQCPHCHTVSQWSQAVDWGTGRIDCHTCARTSFVYLILYPAHRGIKHHTPLDWVPPLLNSGSGYVQPLPSPASAGSVPLPQAD